MRNIQPGSDQDFLDNCALHNYHHHAWKYSEYLWGCTPSSKCIIIFVSLIFVMSKRKCHHALLLVHSSSTSKSPRVQVLHQIIHSWIHTIGKIFIATRIKEGENDNNGKSRMETTMHMCGLQAGMTAWKSLNSLMATAATVRTHDKQWALSLSYFVRMLAFVHSQQTWR